MKISRLWKSPNVQLDNFRADNQFLWQTRLYDKAHYFISYQEALKVDNIDLFSKSIEDGTWGAECFRFNEKLVSRDLLDSVFELNFLSRNLGLCGTSKFKLLDIGAGYGRLGKRLLDVFSGAEYLATDAIPLSQVASKIYLREYIQADRAKIIDFSDIDILEAYDLKIDIAVNIHSFSEMTIDFVKYWLELVQRIRIPYLFVVPNNQELALNDGTNFEPLINSFGYSTQKVETKYDSNFIGDLGIYPDTFFLFKSEWAPSN